MSPALHRRRLGRAAAGRTGSFARDFWHQADVEAALRTELAEALPELLRLLADFMLRIRWLQEVALERIAVRDGRSSADSVLAREFRELISGTLELAGRSYPQLR